MTNEQYAQNRMARVRPLCLDAVNTMRRFLDEAERDLKREGQYALTPEQMVAKVTHAFSWGLANASSDLTNALSSLEDARRVRESQTS